VTVLRIWGPRDLLSLTRLRLAPLTITTLGGVLVVGSLLWYQIELVRSLVIGNSDIGVLEATAYAVLGLIFLGLTVSFLGLTIYLRMISSEKSSASRSSLMNRLSIMIANRRSARVFVLTALGYGLFFGVVSSTLVFQPGVVSSEAYGVRVPSVVPVVCCGAFGQMPQLVVYLTQQIAILIIPSNLILLFAVSWLVGLNAATASYAYINRPKMAGGKWLTGLGAFIGLFTVCPTCAGFFVMEVLGLGGAVGLALTLSSLQTVFIATSIPVLMITPILAMRRICNTEACSARNSANNRAYTIA